jgi:hypothetical protein
MVDEELCPVASPHEVSLPYTVLWFLEGVKVVSHRAQPGCVILRGGRQNSWKDKYPGSAASPGSSGDEGAGSVLSLLQLPVVHRG